MAVVPWQEGRNAVIPSPANFDRVKRSYVAVMMFYRDDRRRCIDGVSEIRPSFMIR